jgi:DNA polymerase-3 subunit alpha
MTIDNETSALKPYIHLRAHTEYSVVDGMVRISDYLMAVKADHQFAAGVSDLNNFFGLIKFYKAALAHKIKPIGAVDTYVSGLGNHSSRLLLIAQELDGYRRICEWLSQAWLKHKDRSGVPHIPFDLLKQDNEGVIVLSGALDGAIGQSLIRGMPDVALEHTKQLASVFHDRFYIEVQRAGFEYEETYIEQAIGLANQVGLPVVATHPIQFLAPEDAFAHDLRVCIAEGTTIHDPRRVSRFKPSQYFQTQAQMNEKFVDLPESLINASELAKRCNLRLALGKSFLPAFVPPEPVPIEFPIEQYLTQTVEKSLAAYLLKSFPKEADRLQQHPLYESRLKSELSVIIKMDFSGYFLIVADFIGWAKHNGVPVGPGRGSGAGSLVAFLLGITNLDPLKYDLLFERFLNPERVSMPDFDIDFCQDKRELVIEYVRRKYGRDSVSQIVTFGSMGAKAVLRDVGRVLDLPLGLCDSLAKLIPNNPTDPWSLERTYREEPQFKERVDHDDEVHQLYEYAKLLEGLTRNVGMHAGGVLIAPGKLTDFCPLYSADEAESSVVSQFDKDDVESVGLVKFDFLGLRNLTTIQWALEYMAQLDPQLEDFDLDSLSLDDPNVYGLFEKANTTSVFQSESQGAKDLEAKLKPDNFEELIALMALNRPGPLGSGMVDDYIARKNQVRQTGQFDESWCFHPSLVSILRSTYGVIVYQEQVMLVAQILSGYTLGGADLLRRAMGKKKPEEMAQQRTVFVKGALENGVKSELAEYLFDLMEKFAEYGFNKSHSAAYALIAYQTAWLKHYHTAAYMAAVLSSEMQDTDDVEVIYRDTINNQIHILPPDINQSHWRFFPVDRENIRYGLGAIKGVGQSAVEAIVAEREQKGAFSSFFNFCRRVDRKFLNRRTLESMIRAGAFDLLHHNRAALLASVDRGIQYAEQTGQNQNQSGLFGSGESVVEEPNLVEIEPWGMAEQLSEEKAALGFSVSGRLFDAYAHQVRPFIKTRLADLKIDQEAWLAAVVSSVRTKMSRRGKLIFVSVEDDSTTQEFLLGQQQMDPWKMLIKEDQLIVFKARVKLDKFTGGEKLYVDEVYGLDQARSIMAQCLQVRVQDPSQVPRLIPVLKNLVSMPVVGETCALVVDYQVPNVAAAVELSGVEVRLKEEELKRLSMVEGITYQIIYR